MPQSPVKRTVIRVIAAAVVAALAAVGVSLSVPEDVLDKLTNAFGGADSAVEISVPVE